MADDLSDAEAIMLAQGGADNHPIGKALLRIVRTVRLIAGRAQTLDARLTALEARVTTLEGGK